MYQSLTETLSRGLNRNVPKSLAETTVRLYKQSGLELRFLESTKALGFLDELAKKVYRFILDNLRALDGEVKTKPVKSEDQRQTKKPKVQKLKLDFDDLEEDVGPALLAKESGPKKVQFKKLKKDMAQKLKEEKNEEIVKMKSEGEPTRSEESQSKTGVENAGLSLSELADAERKREEAQALVEEADQLLEPLEDPLSIENDREWYADESIAHQAHVEDYENLESISRPRSRPQRRKCVQRSGGGFDTATGEYIDYDHNSSEALLLRIPITTHFLIPPFLDGSEGDLRPHFGSAHTSRNTGPSVSAIKDPESELAETAKNGSNIVKDRRAKKERAQQAKERAIGDGGISSVVQEKTEVSKKQTVKENEEKVPFETIQEQRRSLPAYQVRDKLMRVIAENQVVVVIGETGSGKTTQLTQFLCEEGFAKNKEKHGSRLLVGCTQPRRVAAMSVAKRVSEEMGCKLGEEVGYSIRFEDRTHPRKTLIKYLTEGILLREMLADPHLEQYSCIIMDEAHERTLNTDILLGLFKKLLQKRRDLRLIVTSATMNAERFSRFFGEAPQFTIPGRTFPVETFYSKSPCPDYVDTAVKQVMTIHLANQGRQGDILVFMTGQEDIETTCEMIQEKLDMLENPPPLDVYPIYSTLPADIQKKIFNKLSAERRKVVVATNIAETSLTVDGIKFVVDCGLVKLKLFNPKLGMDILQVVPIAMANAQQRSGRAGRTGPGIAYRLYTDRAADPSQMHVQPIPEIQRTNLSSVMLMLKSLHVKDILQFPFLDPPPQDLLSCSLYDLWAIGALDNTGALTALGEQLNVFPMEPTLAKLILLSTKEEFHCSREVIIIVSMLSVPSVFYRPKERADEADAARDKFLIADLDHLTLLNVFEQWELRAKQHKGTLSSWCARNFLHYRSLIRAKDIYNQIMLIMNKRKYPVLKSKSDSDIRKCLCAAYYQQLAKLVKMGGGRGQVEYANLRQAYMSMYIHPTSALAGGGDLSPPYVIYDELVLTSKEYMQCVTAVEPEWLLKYGHVFYGVNSSVRQQIETSLGFTIVSKYDWEKRIEEDRQRMRARVVTKSVEKPTTLNRVRRGF